MAGFADCAPLRRGHHGARARGVPVRDSDHHRIQALRPALLCAGPGRLGPREPRCDGASRRRSRRPGISPGEPAGEPCANPYLFIASQITAGLDGLARSLDPGDLDAEPYSANRQPLPANLLEAVEALDGSELFRRAWGDSIVNYLVMMKRSEWGRFMSHVTDWEQSEYFEVY